MRTNVLFRIVLLSTTRVVVAVMLIFVGMIFDGSAQTQDENNFQALAEKLISASEAELSSLLVSQPSATSEQLLKALMNSSEKNLNDGNLEKAATGYRLAARLAEQSAKPSFQIEALNRLCWTRALQYRYNDAVTAGNQALALARQRQDQKTIGAILMTLGTAHSINNHDAEAINYNLQTLQIAEQQKDKQMMAFVINNLGINYTRTGALSQAIKMYNSALALNQEFGEADTSPQHINLGTLYRLQNMFDLAGSHYEKARAIAEKFGNKEVYAGSLFGLALLQQAQGNYEQALTTLRQELAYLESNKIEKEISAELNTMGEIQFLQGNYEQATESFNRGLRLLDNAGLISAKIILLLNTARAQLKQNNPLEAIKITDSIQDTMTSTWGLSWEFHLVKAQSYSKLGRVTDKENELRAAIQAIESSREIIIGSSDQQANFLANKLEPYHELLSMLVGQNRLSEAYATAQRLNGRVLLDAIQNPRTINAGMTPNEIEQERQLDKNIADLNQQLAALPKSNASQAEELKKQLSQARRDLESFLVKLYAARSEARKQREPFTPLTPDEAGRLIDEQTAAMSFAVTEKVSYLFVLTRTVPDNKVSLKVHTINIARDELKRKTSLLRQRLANQDIRFQAPASELYKTLLEPAQAQLAGKKKLLISPDSVLWELPFQTLISSRAGKPRRYLLENYSVAYTPSLPALKEMTQLRQRQKQSPLKNTLLAFGNPTAEKAATVGMPKLLNEEFLPLPEAETQIKSLQQMFGNGAATSFIGADASEARFKAEAGKYKILHLATHGRLENSSPMYSALRLSPTEKEDGLLEAWEVLNLNLNADLAVLAACETARGRIGNGEGIIGLSWAFLVAGCSTTVVSQWSVESASTTDLMLEFYRRLNDAKSKPSAPEALRQAALKLMKNPKYKHPFYWAGFITIGAQ